MVELVLLLFGEDFARRNAYALALLGAAWGALGIGILIDGLDGVVYFPLQVFGILLLLESLATLLVAANSLGAHRAKFYFKGGIFFFIALLILSGHSTSNLLLAIIFGLSYFVTGLLQITSSWLLRYPRWRMSLAGGCGQLIFALLLLEPYPTNYKGTVPFFIGVTMLLGGIGALRLAARSRRRLRARELASAGQPTTGLRDQSDRPDRPDQSGQSSQPGGHADAEGAGSFTGWTGTAPAGRMTIHVWTPAGSAKTATLPRPIVDRYIAAVDAQGVISTGHAALELGPSLYISLYPAVEIDHSPSDFLKLLRATSENDVPAIYQPDYRTESGRWCPSTRQIVFSRYNERQLHNFWALCQENRIYNLTYRNCSSTVALALEAALGGVLRQPARSWPSAVRTLLRPELWVAAQVRKRAMTMAWTPGLLLDYARALRAIVHPEGYSWRGGLKRARHHLRKFSRQRSQ